MQDEDAWLDDACELQVMPRNHPRQGVRVLNLNDDSVAKLNDGVGLTDPLSRKPLGARSAGGQSASQCFRPVRVGVRGLKLEDLAGG